MRFELVGEAKKVWLMSWSSRFAMLATGSELLDQLRDNLPSLQAYINPHLFGTLTIGLTIAATVARVVKQASLRAATGPANGQRGDHEPQ
jgi:hypothetical protein